jgi:hypothetical protein
LRQSKIHSYDEQLAGRVFVRQGHHQSMRPVFQGANGHAPILQSVYCNTPFLAVTALSKWPWLSATVRIDVEVKYFIATTVITPPATNLAPPYQSRIDAMIHAAIHDALNAIDRRYKPYALSSRPDLGASPEAAVPESQHRETETVRSALQPPGAPAPSVT